MEQNLKITKANCLINACYRLSVNELRIVLYGLAAIDPTSDEFPLEYTFSKSKIADFYQIPSTARPKFYKDIEKALIKQFWRRDIAYWDDERQKIVTNRWLITIRHGGKDDNLSYVYNPEIKHHLHQLSRRFTSYFLSDVAKMKSSYSIRLYEICIMYLNASSADKTQFTMGVDELKEKLDLTGKYSRFNNFNTKVLTVAEMEINKLSNIRLKILPVASSSWGSKIEKVQFSVSRKQKKPSTQKLIHRNRKVSPLVSLDTLEKAKKIILDSGNQWDLYELERQFFDYVEHKGRPGNIDGAFIGFVKKKTAVSP
jgi:plasmid replication initiation protein